MNWERAAKQPTATNPSETPLQRTMRRVMLRMVSFEGGELARRRAPESELVYPGTAENERVKNVLEVLLEARLVVRGKESDGEPYVEPAHDALVRGWDKFLEWIQAEQEQLRLRRVVTPAANDWKLHGGGLWAFNRRLSQLVPLLNSADDWLNATEWAFVDRSRRQYWSVLGSIAGFAIVAFVTLALVTFFAISERDRANERTRVARSGQLAAQALTHLHLVGDDRLEEALNLSLEAIETDTSFEARSSLLTVLQYSPHLHLFLQGHVTNHSAVAFGPDGRSLVAGDLMRDVIVWDTSTDKRRDLKLPESFGYVLSLGFSPDGSKLALGGTKLRLWNVQTETLSDLEPPPKSGSVHSVAFSADGQTLATLSEDDEIRLWDVGRLELRDPPVSAAMRGAYSLALQSTGNLVAAGSRDGAINLWDFTTGTAVSPPLPRQVGDVYAVAFSPDGKILAFGGKDGTVRLFDIESGKPLEPPLEGHTDDVYCLAFHPDGRKIASGGRDTSVILWDLSTRQPLVPPLRGSGNVICSIVFSPDGQFLASSSGNAPLWSDLSITADNYASVILWRVTADPSPGHALKGHQGHVTSLAFRSDSQVLFSGDAEGNVCLWDVTSGTRLGQTCKLPPRSPVDTLTFLEQDNSLVTVSRKDGCFRWKLAEPETRPFHLDQVAPDFSAFGFSANGRTLAVSYETGSTQLWDVSTGRQSAQAIPSREVQCLALSSDGKWVVLAEATGAVSVWDTFSGEMSGLDFVGKRLLDASDVVFDPFTCIALSPDGGLIAYGTTSSEARLITVGPYAPWPERALKAHTEAVTAITFSLDGEMLATASHDRTVVLWDVATGNRIGNPLTGHRAPVTALAFSPDGESLASGGEDRQVILWDVGIEAWKARATRILNYGD